MLIIIIIHNYSLKEIILHRYCTWCSIYIHVVCKRHTQYVSLKQRSFVLSLWKMDLAGESTSLASSTVASSSSSSSVSSTDCDSPRGGDTDHEPLHTTTAVSVSVSVSSSSSSASIQRILGLIRSEDPDSRLFAAREIRRLTKTSHRCRRHFSQAVEPLVSMLRLDESHESHHEAALLALLNLAVKYEKYVSSFLIFLQFELCSVLMWWSD